MLPFTLPRTTTDFADNSALTLPVGPTVWTIPGGNHTTMTLIDTLCPEDRRALRRLRKRLANREHMRRARAARKLCCAGVDLPIEAGTCGRMVHAEAERCIHCAKRRCWLLNHALNPAEVAITGLLDDLFELNAA